MLSAVPVLPPLFRPISQITDKKIPLVADANLLYKEVFDANKNLKELSGQVDDVGDERLALYDSFKAVTGLGDPVQPKHQEQHVRGVLKQIFSSSPKFGVINRKLLSGTVDNVGRAVITPNPDLDMDQVGLPEDTAWEVYKPLLVRSLSKRGIHHVEALRNVENRSPLARDALLQEMRSRPVIINRAPVLHRYGMMAAWPQLVKGRLIK